MFVYVLDLNGQPLMPTHRFGKIRRLLKNKKAKVIKKCPFIIKLLYNSTNYILDLTLGVDTGSAKTGFAVYSNETNEILYQSLVELRNDIKSKMDDRRKCRRGRRTRKTRYRQARWLNRRNSTKRDRFSPTMISKFNSHIREIEFIKSILPITTLVLEIGTFDMALMKNPNMNKHWGYRKGPNYGFENTKAKVLNRDNYTCLYCKGKCKDSKLEVHHIIFRRNGGSDEEDNLITLCKTCHDELHKGNITLKKIGKVKGQLKHATQMNSIRIQLLRLYPEAVETFGYITKANRLLLKLSKDHYIDACVIASSGNIFKSLNNIFIKKCVSKLDRQLCKGIRGEKKIPTYKLFGFRKFDTVKYLNRICFIKGRRSSGLFVIMDIDGNSLDFRNIGGKLNPSYKFLERINTRNSILCVNKIILEDSSFMY